MNMMLEIDNAKFEGLLQKTGLTPTELIAKSLELMENDVKRLEELLDCPGKTSQQIYETALMNCESGHSQGCMANMGCFGTECCCGLDDAIKELKKNGVLKDECRDDARQ